LLLFAAFNLSDLPRLLSSQVCWLSDFDFLLCSHKWRWWVQPPSAALHSSHEPGELSQCFKHDELDWIVQCFTSSPTRYRLYGRREAWWQHHNAL